MKQIKIKHLITYTTCITVLNSCQLLRNKETVIMGMAFDQSTEQPVAGLTINLHNEVTSFAPFSTVGGGIVATTTTDENGWYEFRLDLDSRSRNYYSIEADLRNEPFFNHNWDNGDYHPTVSHAVITAGETRHINMPLVSYAKVDITATNSTEQDSLFFWLTASINGYDRTCYYLTVNSGQRREQGQPDYIPQGEVAFNWHITGDGIDTNISFMQTISQEDSNYIDFNFTDE